MAKTIKEAADNLLKKGNITQEEYDLFGIEKDAAMPFTNPKVIKAFAKQVFKDPKSFGNKLDEYLEHPLFHEEYAQLLEKKPNVMQTIGKGIKDNWWPAAAGVGVVAVGKEAIVDPIAQGIKINKSYNQLAKYTPQLAEMDQDKIRDYFNIVRTYSPNAATNPLVAGALVNKINEFGGIDHKLVIDMINLQSGKSNLESLKTLVGGGLKTISSPGKED
jgi:hypothetical protein